VEEPFQEEKANVRHENLLVKFLDPKTWTITCPKERLSHTNSHFKVVSVIGPGRSGKSSTLNYLAGQDVFATHSLDNKNNKLLSHVTNNKLLSHVTKGIDLFVNDNRIIFLDSQPVMSPSILDDYISGLIPVHNVFSTSDAFTEPDLISMTSMQLTSFLLSVSDVLIVTSMDSLLDVHFIKMLATSVSTRNMNLQKQLNLVWFLSPKMEKNEQVDEMLECLETILGRGNISIVNGDLKQLKRQVLMSSTVRDVSPSTILEQSSRKQGNRRPKNETVETNLTESCWLQSAQMVWEKLVRKPSLFMEHSSRPRK